MTIEHVPAESRGRADFGWLQSRHSFSFGNYMDPDRIEFGTLRVLNDDVVAPGAGFARHPHADMEIISIPTRGALRHGDSMGHTELLPAGDVQVMTAGRGIEHEEHNASKTEDVAFFQIWIRPRARGLTPKYDQKSFPVASREGRLSTIVSPDGRDGSLTMEQDALIARGHFQEATQVTYEPAFEGNGLYLFVIEGKLNVGEKQAGPRDALAIAAPGGPVTMDLAAGSDILLLDVPI